MSTFPVRTPADPGHTTEVSIDWLHAPDLWVLALLVAPVVVLGVWWLYSGERGNLNTPKRLLLSVLRVGLILSLVAFLCEPIRTTERKQTQAGQILVLVDDSYSMSITDRYTDDEQRFRLEESTGVNIGKDTRRIDLVQGFLDNDQIRFLDRLRDKGHVRVLATSDGSRTVAELSKFEEGVSGQTPPLNPIELRGKITRLGDSIYESVNELRGEHVSALVAFTDGRDNGGVLRAEEATGRLQRRGAIPIYTIGVGNPEPPKDVRLFSFDIPEVVLEGDKVAVDYSFVSEGFDGDRTKVTLSLFDLDGTKLGRQTDDLIVLDGEAEVQTQRLEFTPKQSGKFIARLEIELLDGELFEENNFIEKPVTVLSQKIKVLYVEGPPRYEYRYLKNALVLDPTMEAQCLLLSADDHFVQESTVGVQSLRSFPMTREELFEYHVLILGDFAHENYKMPDGWDAMLEEFVDDIGGGVIFLSGPSYLPQKYRGTALEKLFPVELEDSPRSVFARTKTKFHPRRTVEGRDHPVMQFTGDPEQDAVLWNEVPGRSHRSLADFYWYARVKQLKRGGVALAVHPDQSENHIKYGPRPIFAYQYYGRGRTFISLVDSTWRWRRDVGNKYFYQFWGQVIRFVSAGRLLGQTQRFSIATDQREYTLGSQVRVLARALNEEFKPTGDEKYPFQIQRQNDAESTPAPFEALQVPARPAYYEATFEARELGDHKAWLNDERGNEVASTTFRVVVPQVEFEEPRMNEAGLQQIAELSRGEYHRLADAAAVLDKIEGSSREIPISSEQESLWDKLQFLLIFVGIITLEWVLRKAFRLQ